MTKIYCQWEFEIMIYFIEVEKELGNWTNNGACVATGYNANCGPGNQTQTRMRWNQMGLSQFEI